MVGAYSLLAYKEHRFIMPVVPIASILAGKRNTQICLQYTGSTHNMCRLMYGRSSICLLWWQIVVGQLCILIVGTFAVHS